MLAAEQETSVFPLAAFCLLSENSRQGHQLPTAALHRGFASVNSCTATGLQTSLYDSGRRSRGTGKERDAETGLDYFGARYFSGAQGRFTSPDAPFADQHPGDPQSWNLYSYARNNPLAFYDDNGRGTRPAQSKAINDALASDPTLRGVILGAVNFSPGGFEDAYKSGGLSNLNAGAGNILRGLAGEATVINDINGDAGQPGAAFPSPTNLSGVRPDVGVNLGMGLIPVNLPNVANFGGMADVPLSPTVTMNYLEVKSGLSASLIGTGVKQAVATAAAINGAGMAGRAISTLVVDAGVWGSLPPAARNAYIAQAQAGGAYIQIQPGLADAARRRAQKLIDEAHKKEQNQ